MSERDWLGLHAPGVGGNDGVRRLRCKRQDGAAHSVQLFERSEEIVARDKALDGGADILPASPRMETADIGTADRHQIAFYLQVVARSHRAGLIGRGVDAIDGVEN